MVWRLLADILRHSVCTFWSSNCKTVQCIVLISDIRRRYTLPWFPANMWSMLGFPNIWLSYQGFMWSPFGFGAETYLLMKKKVDSIQCIAFLTDSELKDLLTVVFLSFKRLAYLWMDLEAGNRDYLRKMQTRVVFAEKCVVLHWQTESGQYWVQRTGR